ncbi:SAYSvFN domain-containing protein 1 [Uranotaenia lowii]|uniref:SAYSvFN domain-containing protein 1 n=1 Tax=Uranotaenia lowii TaxID=190385 RepID=UPI00247916CF|nr:SAYSvFN domain-containing protein 1 [Uranotaenia lowii]
MEAKLNSYRSQKRRQAVLNQFRERLYNMVSFQQVRREDEKATHVIVEADIDTTAVRPEKIAPVHTTHKSNKDPGEKVRKSSTTESIVSTGSGDSFEQPPDGEEVPKPPRSYLTYVTYFVYFLFWATLYAIAIELRFGVVFLMLSALVGIYFNTRTEPKPPGEVSAYSVFNANCESIDGTLKAEQFEREIGIRH